MVAPVKRNNPYNLDPRVERHVVTLCCSRMTFYGRIGTNLDPELLRDESAQHALRAAHSIAHDLGHGPKNPLLVLQRLRRLMDDGRITLEAIRKVADMFDTCEDEGLLDEESLASELTPMLQQRLRDDAVQAAIESFGRKGDLSRAMALEEKAMRVGQVDTSVGTILGPESFNEIVALKDLERLSTNILELDSVLDGGLQAGGLGVCVGGSGDGKSMFLTHQAGGSVVAGLHVAYATLELPRPMVMARIKANMTGVPINTLLSGDVVKAQRRLDSMGDRLGRLVVQEFTPYVSTVEDIIEWVDRVEQQSGRKIDLLAVDYGDKIGVKAKKGDQQSSEYTSGRVVFEGLRVYAHAQKKFCWTASQASRQKDRKRKLDLNDVADSMHKIRVADLVITFNLEDMNDGESPMLTIRVAKHRTGRSRVEVGPLVTMYELGRVCPVTEAFT